MKKQYRMYVLRKERSLWYFAYLDCIFKWLTREHERCVWHTEYCRIMWRTDPTSPCTVSSCSNTKTESTWNGTESAFRISWVTSYSGMFRHFRSNIVQSFIPQTRSTFYHCLRKSCKKLMKELWSSNKLFFFFHLC